MWGVLQRVKKKQPTCRLSKYIKDWNSKQNSSEYHEKQFKYCEQEAN